MKKPPKSTKRKASSTRSRCLQYRPEKTVHLYDCDGYVDYMYSRMLPSTGYLHEYKLRLYSPGFLLQYPRAEAGGKIPEFEDAPTFGRTLKEIPRLGQDRRFLDRRWHQRANQRPTARSISSTFAKPAITGCFANSAR
jgi:hypothetical protein